MKVNQLIEDFAETNERQNKEFDKRQKQIEKLYKEKVILESERGKVGIFWIGSDNRIIPFAIDWVDQLESIEMLPGWTSRVSHSDPLPLSTLLGLYPNFKGIPWDHVPRGRVFFKPIENKLGEYSVYLPKEYLNNDKVKNQILTMFNLPKNLTDWNTDSHYNKHTNDNTKSNIVGTAKEPWE